jgi:hypothetical protein
VDNASFGSTIEAMNDSSNQRLYVNLKPEDRDLLEKAKAAFEKRTGAVIPKAELFRLAIRALAKQENVS